MMSRQSRTGEKRGNTSSRCVLKVLHPPLIDIFKKFIARRSRDTHTKPSSSKPKNTKKTQMQSIDKLLGRFGPNRQAEKTAPKPQHVVVFNAHQEVGRSVCEALIKGNKWVVWGFVPDLELPVAKGVYFDTWVRPRRCTRSRRCTGPRRSTDDSARLDAGQSLCGGRGVSREL